MIYSKASLEVVSVASKEPLDRGLNGVRLESDGTTVGGNGRMFMAVEPITYMDKVQSLFGEVGEVEDNGLVLPLDTVERALRLMPKGGGGVLKHVALTKVGHRVGFTSLDAKGDPTTNAGLAKRDPYPDWKGIVRKVRGAGEGVRICISRKDLIQLLEAMDAACPDRSGYSPVFIEVSDDGAGIVLRSVNAETGQRVVGVVSTIETKGQWLPRNIWERVLFGVKAIAKRLI